MDDNDIDIDEEVVKRLEKWILFQEGMNLRTGKNRDQQMVAKIMKEIEEEVGCSLNR